jgi:hypothetical protein
MDSDKYYETGLDLPSTTEVSSQQEIRDSSDARSLKTKSTSSSRLTRTSTKTKPKKKATLRQYIFKVLWGQDYNDYNTVAHSSIPFWYMQLFRNLAFVVLLCLIVPLIFIYVKWAFFKYETYSLLSATLAFFFLFIGSGKQKCYQTKIENPEMHGSIKYEDPERKEDEWTWGVFFYCLALPLNIIGATLFELPFRNLFSG